jgi:hypothetical protein
MRTLSYFWHKAILTTRRGKFHARSWKQFTTVLLLSIEFFILTGRSIDILNQN